MRIFLNRTSMVFVFVFGITGCQQSPVALLPGPEQDIGLTSTLKQRMSVATDHPCMLSDAINAEPLYTLFCTHQALQKPVTNAEQFQRLLREQQSALNQLVLHHLVDGQWQLQGQGYRLRLELPTDEHGMTFSRYTPVQQLKFEDVYYQPPLPAPDAYGVAMVAERRHSRAPFDQYYPREGIFRSVTVTLEAMKLVNNELTISLKGHYLTAPQRVPLAGRLVPLNYDPASATLLLLRDARIDQSAFSALLDGNKPGYDFGIFSPGPIRPDRRPILMIHGLNSSPMIWLKLSHAIYRDPQLSAHYQVWHAFYPSGAPPFFNAMRLRHDVDQMRNQLQQRVGLSDKMPMVVIGHSMGGIIAKTFVIDSGMALWDETFLFRPEAWPGKDKDLQRYRDVFLFQARQDVDSVFFLDTPHHGADIAEAWYSRLASKLITIPDMFAKLNRKLFQRIRLETVTPQMQPYLSDGGPNSVQVLSPQHPLLRKIATLPYQRPVYSVVGSDDKPYCYDEGACARLSDSVVPFFSAHEPRSAAQIIVPSQHDSYQSPEAIAFILAQLRQRLDADGSH
jgi:pimeloyl-ACP methyl ester carboxylesterase